MWYACITSRGDAPAGKEIMTHAPDIARNLPCQCWDCDAAREERLHGMEHFGQF